MFVTFALTLYFGFFWSNFGLQHMSECFVLLVVLVMASFLGHCKLFIKMLTRKRVLPSIFHCLSV